MSSKNVAIRKDVYEALRREKRPRESFTQLFLRLLHQRAPTDELYAAWGKDPTGSAERIWRGLRGAAHRGR